MLKNAIDRATASQKQQYWKGFYWYYGLGLRLEFCHFKISWSNENGLLLGHCTEEETWDFMGSLMTVGEMQGGLLKFSKIYPYAYGRTVDGWEFVDREQAGHEVHYTGFLKGSHYEGKWEIYSAGDTPISAGAWIMYPTIEDSPAAWQRRFS